MTRSEKSYEITSLPLRAPNNPLGLAISVTGLPLVGPDNVVRIGAAGQGAVGKNMRAIFRQTADYDVGNKTREIMGVADSERSLPDVIAERVAIGDYSIDHALDNEAIVFLLEQMELTRAAGRPAVAVVETKLMPQILQLESAPQLPSLAFFRQNVISLVIGVDSSEEVANARKVSASRIKAVAKKDTSIELTLAQASELRAARYVQDRDKYLGAYGIPYTPDSVRGAVNVVFDNTPVRTGQEMRGVLYDMLLDLAKTYPAIAPYLINIVLSPR